MECGRPRPRTNLRAVNVAIIQGHPDPAGGHFGHALAAAYADAAKAAGHEVKTIEVAKLEFALLRSAGDWQALRPGFAFGEARAGRLPQKLLKGRSARIVVTMGMPAFFYRVYYRSHSVKNLKRNILEFVGVSPVHTTLIGMVEGKAKARERHLAAMAKLVP